MNKEEYEKAKLIAQQEEMLEQARLNKQLKLQAMFAERERTMVTDVDEEDEDNTTYTVELENDKDTKIIVVQEKKEKPNE